MCQSDHEWDVFISHASEDKLSFVRPLAEALERLGVRVWYDEFSLKLGDSISRAIDRGLTLSRYGVVVISPRFLDKPWPEYELRGLTARQVAGETVIIPLWHGVTHRQVLDFSPPLADLMALDTADLEAEHIALRLLQRIRPDLYTAHPREQHLRTARGEALLALQAELDRTREELSAFRCPFCGAHISEMLAAPVDPRGDHTAALDIFECGYQTLDGLLERPCPSDPRFPKFEDYQIEYTEDGEGESKMWHVNAVPLTEMARMVPLFSGLGRSKTEALEMLRGRYDKTARPVAWRSGKA
jgi:hypothetical protein